MTSELKPSAGSLGAFSRTFNIVQARVRKAQYSDLEHGRRTSLLRGLMFIHLKEDLDMDPIDWVGCLDPIEKKPKRLLTSYGISKVIQEELASIRTQLDSFSDIEAYALMTSAYRMTDHAFKNKRCVDGFSDKGVTAKWKFLEVDPSLKGEAERFDFVEKLLAVSSVVAFKIWKLLPSLKVTAVILAMLAVAGVIYGFIRFADSPIPFIPKTIGDLGMLAVSLGVMALIGYLLGTFVVKTLDWYNTLFKIALGIFGCLIGFIAARIHLHFFDRLYLKYGSIDSYRK